MHAGRQASIDGIQRYKQMNAKTVRMQNDKKDCSHACISASSIMNWNERKPEHDVPVSITACMVQ
jgi:hypothetical protein